MSEQVEQQLIDDLVKVLEELGPGKLDGAHTARVEEALAEAWHLLDDDMRGGMAPYKLEGRTRDLKWEPPRLSFKIVRHGTPYTRQYWTVDLETLTARFDETVLVDRSPEHRAEIKRKALERFDAGDVVPEDELQERTTSGAGPWSTIFEDYLDPLVLAFVDGADMPRTGSWWFDLQTGGAFQYNEFLPEDVVDELGDEEGDVYPSDLRESDRFELLNDGWRRVPVEGQDVYALTREDVEEIAETFLRSRGFKPQLWTQEESDE